MNKFNCSYFLIVPGSVSSTYSSDTLQENTNKHYKGLPLKMNWMQDKYFFGRVGGVFLAENIQFAGLLLI